MTDLQRPDGSNPDPTAPSGDVAPPDPANRPAFDLLGGSHRQQQPAPAPKAPAGGKGQAVLRLGILAALLVAAGLAWGWWVVIVIVSLLVMIFMHELGHYLAARRAGMKVTEFFLGFGPRIWSYRRGEVEYGVKAVPAGAYVKIIGMSNLEQVDPLEEPRTYRAKPYWSRFCVGVAGSAMHFAMALALLFAVFAVWGQRSEDVWHVGAVSENSPAASVGLQQGDEVVSVDGVAVTTYDDFRAEVRKHPGETIELEIVRNGEPMTLEPTLRAETAANGTQYGFLGIGAEHPFVDQSIPQAAVDSFATFGDITWQSIAGLAGVFSFDGVRNYVDNVRGGADGSSNGTGTGGGVDNDRLVSPVGAVSIGAQLAGEGLATLLLFLAAINIFIGLFNLVPLPPFDGGHIAVATYEEIRSRKRGRRYYADVTKLMPVAYVVVAVLMVMFVGNLYLDIVNPVKL